VSDDICPNCKQPKPGGSSGSLTQWIFVCHCASLKATEPDNYVESHKFQVCRKCRKRVSTGREGSLTQFVFRSDSCRCEFPEVLDVAIARPLGEDQSVSEDPVIYGDDVEGLDLPPESFPSERFKPIRELGRGASGAVYLCIDKLLGNNVAVKTLHHLSAEQLLSFQQEARAISRLTHSNIVQILDFGATESGIPYMVLEYLRGVDLETYCAEHGVLPLNVVVNVVNDICSALAYSHSKDIFHRDLKPSNMLVVEKGSQLSVKLVDFGVARVKFETTTPTVLEGTSVIGTPAYMSPDQMRGISFDQRSEVYSLGCILFELLTGRQIYGGETVMEIVSQHVNAPIPKLDEVAPEFNHPEKLDQILQRCLAKDPAHRYQSMNEVKADLEELSYRSESEDESRTAGDGETPSVNREYTEALQQALWKQALEANDEVAAAGRRKRVGVPIAIACFLVLCVVGGGIFFFGESIFKTKKVAKTADVLNDPLTDNSFQINEFNGNYWVFNMRPVSDRSIAEVTRKVEGSDRLWFDSGYLSPAGILKLKPLKVVAFAIINLQLSDQHFASLKKLKTIKALRLFENPGIADRHLGIIAEMDNLEELFIRSSKITDDGIALIGGMKNLKYLSLDRCTKLTDKSLDTLEKMTNLERLSLTKTRVSLAGVRRVAKMKNLNTICVSYLPCDTTCVKEFAKLNLSRLAMQRSMIVDSDLNFLIPMKTLQILDVKETMITKKAVQVFHEARKRKGLPFCQVLREKRSGIDGFGAMVYETVDDEHMWTDSQRPVLF